MAMFPCFLGFSEDLQSGEGVSSTEFRALTHITPSPIRVIASDDKTKVIVPLWMGWNSATGRSDDISKSGTRGHSFHFPWREMRVPVGPVTFADQSLSSLVRQMYPGFLFTPHT